MFLNQTGQAPSCYPPPPSATGNTLSGPETPPDLEAIFHVLLGAANRVRVQDQQLTEAIARLRGSWPTNADCAEKAPVRDGFIPAIAAACDELHRAIDRMQLPIDMASKL